MSDQQPVNDEMQESWWEQRAEAFAAWAENLDPSDLRPLDTRALQQLSKLAGLRQDIDDAILAAVREARQQCSTWSEIGSMLGVTKQAAQQRFTPLLASDPPEDPGRASTRSLSATQADRLSPRV
ncbi:MAG: hypothetical protein OXC06_07490 [Acidimicrobiaceae bacterium]|nr:hypothetical protein [Acidimicrobiaceae bacterium]